MTQEQNNIIDEAVSKLKAEITEKVNSHGVYKRTSCDFAAFGWNTIHHQALHAIVRRGGIEGIHITHEINFGVTDWTFTKF